MRKGLLLLMGSVVMWVLSGPLRVGGASATPTGWFPGLMQCVAWL